MVDEDKEIVEDIFKDITVVFKRLEHYQEQMNYTNLEMIGLLAVVINSFVVKEVQGDKFKKDNYDRD